MSEHAPFSPSHAVTWATCTASHALEAQCPPREESASAKEGTLAHALLEQCLSFGVDPESRIAGMDVPEKDQQEMVDGVHVALDYVNRRLVEYPGAQVFIEKRLTLTEDCYGTGDIILYLEGVLLEVIDFKYGAGHLVSVMDNPQLEIYLIGAASLFDVIMNNGPSLILMSTVIQPRIQHQDGFIRSTQYDGFVLVKLYSHYTGILKDIRGGNVEFAPSQDACRWCGASGNCQAQHDYSLTQAGLWFADIEPVPTVESIEAHAIESPGLLSMESRAVILQNVELIRAWLKAVEVDSLERAIAVPGCIPNFKVVEGGTTHRKFDLEDDPLIKLFRSIKLKRGEYSKFSLLGPAPIETLLKGKLKREEITPKQQAKVMNHVIKPRGARTLVSASDPRPAIVETTSAMFADVPTDVEPMEKS